MRLKSYFFILLFSLASVSTLAAQSITHKVADEETLFSIAQKYHVTVKQLKKWNGLSGNGISIGQTLVIKPGKEKEEKEGIYRIKPHDTLFSIAQQFGVTVVQLKKWNSKITAGIVEVGQILQVQPMEGTPAGKKMEPMKKKAAGSGAKNSRDGYYTVKANDTLFSIAQQFGIAVSALKKWNNLAETDIKIGQKLKVQPVKQRQSQKAVQPVQKPVHVAAVRETEDGYYTVKSGDTLFRIAQQFGMEVEKLKALNNLTTNNIHVGQELKIRAGSNRPVTMAAEPGAVIRYELKQGMELEDFLRIFEMSKQRFKQLNPGMKATYLNKGQVVSVVVPKSDYEAISTSVNSNLKMLGAVQATRYAFGKKGTVTTNGELYSPQALTAAHASIAIGSVIFVKNPVNGQGVMVRINDRLTGKGLKLSKAAWQALGLSGRRARVYLYRIK